MTRQKGISVVILAGGLARRMGGADKGLVMLDGRPLVAHVAEALAPQVNELLINANRNLDRYAALGYPVVQDEMEGFQGPLAGMLSAMRRAAHPLLLVVPCDAPLLPPDFATRMRRALEESGADLAVATDGSRLQPVHALLRCRLAGDLEEFLAGEERKIDRWYARHSMAKVAFPPETFYNVNTPEQLAGLEEKGEMPA